MTNTSTPDKRSQHHGQHHDELEDVKQFIESYGKPLITVLVIVIVSVGVFYMLRTRQANRICDAGQRLALAQSTADFDTIVEDYANTPAAPRALLALAKLHFDNGNYEIAFEKYESFLQQYPDDPMMTTAALGRIFCIEARNYESALQDAASAYEKFASTHSDSFLAPQAIFGQARCLEQLDQLNTARTKYEDFMAHHAESPWTMRAEELLERVNRKIDARDEPKKTVASPDTDTAVVDVPARDTNSAPEPAVIELPATDTPTP